MSLNTTIGLDERELHGEMQSMKHWIMGLKFGEAKEDFCPKVQSRNFLEYMGQSCTLGLKDQPAIYINIFKNKFDKALSHLPNYQKKIPFLVQSFFEALQYCDQWQKFKPATASRPSQAATSREPASEPDTRL